MNTLKRFALAVTIFCFFSLIVWAQNQMGPREANTVLNGTNLTYYPQPSVDRCEADCANNARCKGFTWIKEGTYNPRDAAMCYLVSAVGVRTSYRGHISGEKVTTVTRGGSGPLQGTWQYGGWYYDITQTGNTFTWTRRGDPESAKGTINGDKIEVTWTGSGGSGSGKGNITEWGPNGQAKSFTLPNGPFVRVQ